MRLSVDLDAELVRQLDQFAGPKGRSAYVADAVRAGLNERKRLEGENELWAPDLAAWADEATTKRV